MADSFKPDSFKADEQDSFKPDSFKADTPKKPQGKGFLGELWNEISHGPANLLATGNAINNAVMHPMDTINAMGAGINDMAGKTAESFKQGDYVKGVRRAINTGINAVIPGLGTSSESAGEKFDQGDYAGGAGQTLGIGVNTALGIKTPQLMEGTANLPSAVKGAFRADPRVAINRGLRPVPSDPNFPARVPQTLAAIKQANGGKIPGGVTDGTLDLIPATQRTIDANTAAFGKWMDRAKGIRISGNPVVDATREATKGMLPSESGSSQALVERAMQDYGTEFSPEQLKARLELLNKRLDPFYSKAPGKQSSALADIPDAVLKAQRDTVARILYEGLDPEGAGMGPRQIQSQTGDMIDMVNAAKRRNNAIVAEQPLTPIGRVVDPIKGAIRSVLPGKATGSGIAYAEGSEGRSLPMIRKAFKAVGDDPVNVLPQPNGLYPTGDTTRMLPPPSPRLGPPPDGSFVRSVPGQRIQNPARQLPPGTAPFTQGTSVPDNLGRPGQGTPFNSGLIEQGQSQGGNFTRPNIITPPPADTSFVRGAQGMNAPPFQRKGLPAPSTTEVPPSSLSRPTGETLPQNTGAASDASFVRSVPATINPATGKPWTPEELKTFPHYAKGGIIRHPELAIVGEDGPEAIVPLGPPPKRNSMPPPSVKLKPQRSAKQKAAIFEAMRRSKRMPIQGVQ